MSLNNKIKKLEKQKIDNIKANWDVSDEDLGLNFLGNQIELSEYQQIFLHLLLTIEELETKLNEMDVKIKDLEKAK